jgi:hypothetical protein
LKEKKMRKILWYRTSFGEDGKKLRDGEPVYYTGPWWAFFIRGILWNWGCSFTDWASSIEGKYLEPEVGEKEVKNETT